MVLIMTLMVYDVQNHEFGQSKMEYSRLNVSPYSGAYS